MIWLANSLGDGKLLGADPHHKKTKKGRESLQRSKCHTPAHAETQHRLQASE